MYSDGQKLCIAICYQFKDPQAVYKSSILELILIQFETLSLLQDQLVFMIIFKNWSHNMMLFFHLIRKGFKHVQGSLLSSSSQPKITLLNKNLFIFLLKFSIFSFYFPDVFTLVNLPLRILYGDFSNVS